MQGDKTRINNAMA